MSESARGLARRAVMRFDARVWRGVMFDLDGTLVDSLPGIAEALNRALAACGLAGHPDSAVRGFIGCGARELARRALPAGLPDAEEVAARVEEGFRRDYAATWRAGTRVYPGVREAVAELAARGILLGVISNKPHAFVVEMVAELLPEIDFAVVLGQREGVPRKPDPAILFEALRVMGCEAAAAVLIGDSTVDIATARNAGVVVAAVTWGYHDRETLARMAPDRWVEAAEELRRFGGQGAK